MLMSPRTETDATQKQEDTTPLRLNRYNIMICLKLAHYVRKALSEIGMYLKHLSMFVIIFISTSLFSLLEL